VSLLVLAGIVAALPRSLFQIAALVRTGSMSIATVLVLAGATGAFIAAIVFIELAQRRLAVQYPSRRTPGPGPAGDSSFLPLKINPSGVIPPIFASSLLLLPATVTGFLDSALQDRSSGWPGALLAQLQHGRPLFMALYGVMIVFFTFFYTSVVFNPQETADNLRRHGGFLPGVRPGKQTAEHLDRVLSRITVLGAVYITVVCLLPEALIGAYDIPLYLGGASLLIVVVVAIDFLTQLQSHLVAHQYEAVIRKARLRPRPVAPTLAPPPGRRT
jgi:preprotein translocase subunit SecY